jgi:hypothetical protein
VECVQEEASLLCDHNITRCCGQQFGFRVLTATLWTSAGTIGHVAHGKSTVVKAISGVQTVRFKNELERNITIKLGYANAKIYECTSEVRLMYSPTGSTACFSRLQAGLLHELPWITIPFFTVAAYDMAVFCLRISSRP